MTSKIAFSSVVVTLNAAVTFYQRHARGSMNSVETIAR